MRCDENAGGWGHGRSIMMQLTPQGTAGGEPVIGGTVEERVGFGRSGCVTSGYE